MWAAYSHALIRLENHIVEVNLPNDIAEKLESVMATCRKHVGSTEDKAIPLGDLERFKVVDDLISVFYRTTQENDRAYGRK